MNKIDLFPLQVATGEAFCDREHERDWLKNNFEKNRHSLIMSPRRYGKTSLIFRAIEENGYPYAHADLFSCLNLKDVEKKILGAIGQGITNMMPKLHEMLQTIKSTLANLHVSIKLHEGNISLKIDRSEEGELKQNLLNALKGLEKLATKFGKNEKMIFFLDEFQELAFLDEAKSIEAIIREVAQLSPSLCFVFSGSNRHLLGSIFEDSQKPLYTLCDKLELKRIDTNSYIHHIKHASFIRWEQPCDEQIIMRILELTERHPYYVNVLCGRLWDKDQPPDAGQAEEAWLNYINGEISRVAQDISKLSRNQRKLLIALAKYGEIKEPSSQQFLGFIGISNASVRQSLKVLLNQDMVYLGERGYKVLDPLFKAVLQK